jgi:hypothetical protein
MAFTGPAAASTASLVQLQSVTGSEEERGPALTHVCSFYVMEA